MEYDAWRLSGPVPGRIPGASEVYGFPFGLPKHPYRIIIDVEAMKRIREEYTYEYYGIKEEI